MLALYKHPTGGGKLVVLGSAAMLSDQYIDKEDNSRYRSQIAASFGAEPPLLVQRYNGTTAGLGYLEVNVICPCKSPPWTVG